MDKRKIWWKRHKDAVISTIISVVIGYLLGFYLDSYINVMPELNAIKENTQCLSDSLAKYRNEANVAIEYVIYNSPTGIPCKVGISNEVKDHFVAVDANNSHGLNKGDKIFLINENDRDFCSFTKTVFVQLVKDSPKSSADFFINKNMLKSLNIGPEKLSQGVFTLQYKREK